MFDDYQIAHDIARFYNMIHDGIDACRHVCRLKQPDTGSPIEAEQGKTVVEIAHASLRSWSNAALVNHNAVVSFSQAVGVETAKSAVSSTFGISADNLITRLQSMRDMAQYIYNNCLSWDEAQMATAADYLDANIPPWKSIRRRWSLSG